MPTHRRLAASAKPFFSFFHRLLTVTATTYLRTSLPQPLPQIPSKQVANYQRTSSTSITDTPRPWQTDEMAMLLNSSNYSNTSSSNNYYSRKTSTESSRRSNTQASAYVVDAASMALTGFHFSTCGGGATGWWV